MTQGHALLDPGPLPDPVGMVLLEPPLPPHEQGRADFYALIAALLLAPPAAQLLHELAQAPPLTRGLARSPLEQSWERLVAAASAMDEAAVSEEYSALFVALGTPQVDPYASRYLASALMDVPLAALRADLRALGLARTGHATEIEDHLGALCEVMRVLIAGAPGIPRQPVSTQKRFFEARIAPWHSACLDDLRRAEGSNFYRCVADFIAAYFAVEAEAFAIDEPEDDDRGDAGGTA